MNYSPGMPNSRPTKVFRPAPLKIHKVRHFKYLHIFFYNFNFNFLFTKNLLTFLILNEKCYYDVYV